MYHKDEPIERMKGRVRVKCQTQKNRAEFCLINQGKKIDQLGGIFRKCDPCYLIDKLTSQEILHSQYTFLPDR